MTPDNIVSIVRQKPATCTKCGRRRVIEFVCTMGMDEVDPDLDFPTNDCERKPMKRELCKECTTSKNKCHHWVCLQNYRERDQE